jgi:hypothetical protein
MTVNTVLIPSVSVAITSGSQTICAGNSVTFTATPTNGGTPTYQWKKDGIAISGETNATFTSTTLANNEMITVEMTSTETCLTAPSAVSTGITMTVNTVLIPSVSVAITSGSQTICAGNSVTFTATPTNGGTPTYQWKKSGIAIGGETNATFTSTTLANNEAITVEMTSTESCVSAASAISPGIKLTVNTNPTVTANNNSSVCQGSSVNFSASGLSSSSNTFTYQWSGPNGFTSNLQNPTLTNVNNLNIGTYTISILETNLCSATATTSVVVNSKPSIPTLTADILQICKSENATLTGTCSAVTDIFRWSTAASNQTSLLTLTNTHTRTVAEPGIYKAFCESNKGCVSDEANIVITQNSNCNGQVFLTISPANPVICPNTSIILTASGCSSTVTWQGGSTNVTGASATFSPSVATVYNVSCSLGGSTTVNVLIAISNEIVASNVDTGKSLTKAINTIESNKKVGKIDITPGSNVIYEAGNAIVLLPGFAVEKHSVFKAEIKKCLN